MNRRRFLHILFALGLAIPTLPASAQGNALLKEFVAQTRTLSGQFTQTVYDRNGRKTQEARGHFSLARPGKFRWAYEQPYAQLIVADGTQVWVYDADLEQVTVRRADRALGDSPAALLAGSNDIERFFHVREATPQDGLDWLEATPKGHEGSFNRIRLGFRAGELQAMELKDAFGQTTVLRFNGLQKNPRLGANVFRFTPPKGVDILSGD